MFVVLTSHIGIVTFMSQFLEENKRILNVGINNVNSGNEEVSSQLFETRSSHSEKKSGAEEVTPAKEEITRFQLVLEK